MSDLRDAVDEIIEEMAALYREVPELRDEMQRLRRQRATARIRAAFIPLIRAHANPYRGLGLLWFGSFDRRAPGRAPWGWRWLKEPGRNAAILLPLWLYWPIYLRRYWRSYVYDSLIRLGFWKVREGDFYRSGEWTWNFLRTLAWYRRDFPLPVSGWERFGRTIRNAAWCFAHDADTAQAPMWWWGL